MAEVDDYKNVLTDLVKKQMIMLGPGVALATARKVGSIKVENDGTVSEISQDPHKVMQEVTTQYMNLSGQIAQTTLTTILEKYPNIKKPQNS